MKMWFRRIYFNNEHYFSLILLIYFIMGLFFLNIYKYHINTDAPTYIAIAEKYATGHISDAINSFWSPMISWLMVPFLLLGMEGLVAFKFIGLIAGVFAFFALKKLLLDFSVSEDVSHILMLGLFPAFYAFTLITVNPDFLLAVILLFYMQKIISLDYGKSYRNSIVCGLLGAAAYLTKGFAFPFFVSHFTAMNLFRYFATVDLFHRKRIRASFLLGLSSFMLISVLWISIISLKSGRVTFNDAGSYNYKLIVRDHWRMPFDRIGFIAPPDPMAGSVWDNPNLLFAEVDRPFGGIKHRMAAIGRNSVKNIFDAINAFQASSLFSMTIIIFSVLHLMGLPTREILVNRVFLILVTIFLYTAGYLPLLVTKRYLYMNILLIFVLGGYLIDRYDFGGHGQKKVAILFLCLSMMFMPLRDLRATSTMGKDFYIFSKALKKMGVSGRIVSNGHFDDLIFATYHLRAKYYGIAKPGIDDPELLKELNKYHINYYFCWQDRPCSKLLSTYSDISEGKFNNLRIFKILPAL
ncbi:MAG: hypothetical protein ACYDH8_10890 [Syntrophales bacterium]